MFCSNCGTQLSDNAVFCSTCGTKTGDTTVQAEAVQPQVKPAPYVPEAVLTPPKSEFDGGFWGLLGVNLLVGLVSVISLGFAFPAMYCFRLRWFYKHTVINGKRLAFNGKGRQLFGRYILWCFLSVITCGIFALWLPIKYKKWETKHVEFAQN